MTTPIDTIETVRRLRAGQQQRVADFLTVARDFFRPMLDPRNADWTIELTTEAGRLDLQLAVAFFESAAAADHALANCLVRRAPVPAFPSGHRFDIFQTSIAAHLLARYEPWMTPEAVRWCEQLLVEGCPNNPGMMTPDYQFHGYNDNMPAMTCKTLILAGERLEQPGWVECGLHRLEQAAELLSRRGLISEFNSPNYLPDTINAFDMIVDHARTPEARELARQILPRLWIDAAAHWHPRGRATAGPHSRAYGADFLNHLSPMKALVWYLFGTDVAGLTPHEACKPRPGLLLMHCGDPLEHTVRCIWYAGCGYRSLSDDTAALFIAKPDPFELVATAEFGDDGAHPIRRTVCTTWMRPAYSLGTTTASLCGGEQTSTLYVTAASDADAPPVAGVKYLVDDNEPGNIRESDWHVPRTGEDWVVSHGEMAAVQHQCSALLWAEPQLKLADTAVERLRLAYIIASAFEAPAELIVGGRRIAEWQGRFSADQWIGVRCGEALIGLRPLAGNVFPVGTPEVVLRRSAKCHWIEILNYNGPRRSFSRTELSRLQNGLAIEVAAASDYPSLNEFITQLDRQTVIQDYFFFRTRRLRYRRNSLPDREAVLLSLTASVEHGSALVSVNGVEPGGVPWRCTGIPAEDLPFLAPGHSFISKRRFQWRNLGIHWYPNDPWAIFAADNHANDETVAERAK